MAEKIKIVAGIDGDIDIDEYSFITLQEEMLCEQFLEFLRKSDPQKLNQLKDAMDRISQGLNPNY